MVYISIMVYWFWDRSMFAMEFFKYFMQNYLVMLLFYACGN